MALTAFDPARYLREVADRTVDDPQRLRPTPTALLAAAQALVAVAQIDEAVAQHILDEHEEVLRRRDRNRSIAWTREWPTEPLAARRVLLGTDEEVAHREGSIRVRYAVFGAETRVAVSLRRKRRPRLRNKARFPFGMLGANVAGDDGRTVRAGFSGGGRRQVNGVLRCDWPLDLATRSIAIDDARFELVSATPQVEVRLEELAPAEPALRHLRRCAVLAGSLGASYLDAASDALVAAGAIAPDDPELTTLRTVAAAISLTGDDGPEALAALPEPWRAWWHADREGPDRLIPVGAVTPLFDGVTVAIDVLESSTDRWSLAVQIAPEGATSYPWETPTARLISVEWWAEDDRGRRYLSTGHSSGGNASRGSGHVVFHAPLDPRARWIELQPTAETTRAVIHVPLD